MDLEAIERELYVEATPEIAFEVVSRPEHLKQWWPDDARYQPTPGSVGEISFGDHDAGGTPLRMTETGFRDRGWDVAVLEQMHQDHINGWDFFLPRLAPYVATIDPGR